MDNRISRILVDSDQRWRGYLVSPAIHQTNNRLTRRVQLLHRLDRIEVLQNNAAHAFTGVIDVIEGVRFSVIDDRRLTAVLVHDTCMWERVEPRVLHILAGEVGVGFGDLDVVDVTVPGIRGLYGYFEEATTMPVL